MKQSIFLLIILVIFLLVLLVRNIQPHSIENFLNPYNPGEFPSTQEHGILTDVFQAVPNPQVGINRYKDNIASYPRRKIASFDTETNNIQHWETPDNGRCLPAEFCGSFYST